MNKLTSKVKVGTVGKGAIPLTDSSPEQVDRSVMAVAQLKSVGITLKQEGNIFKFYIPSELEKQLRKVYNFSFDELKVGADIPLAELAKHINEQAANQANASVVAEFLRHMLNVKKNEYDVWYHKAFAKCRLFFGNKYVTDKIVHSHLIGKYSVLYLKKQQEIAELEFVYRLVNNAILAAWQVKGKMLQSLRLNVQGDERLDGISAETKNKMTLET